MSLVVIRTPDFQRSKRFYGKKLGLKLRINEEENRWCHFDAGGVELGVQGLKPSEKISRSSPIYLAFQVDDIEHTVTEMKNVGVEFTSRIRKNYKEGFKQISGLDPDGNKIVLFQFTEFHKSSDRSR